MSQRCLGHATRPAKQDIVAAAEEIEAAVQTLVQLAVDLEGMIPVEPVEGGEFAEGGEREAHVIVAYMRRLRWRWLPVALLSLAVLGAPRTLRAQERRGFIIGGAIGVGELVTNDHELRRFSRISVPNLKVGAMLNPNLALFLYVPTGIHRRDGAWRAFEGILVTAQLWLSARVWVMGGAGAQLDFPVFGTKPVGFYVGPGAAIAVGCDLVHLGAATVDVGTRLVAGTVRVEGERRNGAAVDAFVGLNWY